MLLKNFLMTLPLTLLISACATPEPTVVTVPTVIRNEIPAVARPKPVNLSNVKIYVVTAETFDAFLKEFTEKNGDLVYIAISVEDYENLSNNIAELRRYLNQQKEIIVYYEEAIKTTIQ